MAESDSAKPLNDSSTIEYKVYPQRYLISALFSFSLIFTCIMLNCFNPILTNLKDIYDITLFQANFGTSLISPAIYPIANFIANYVLDEYGLKLGMGIANTCLIMGFIFRFFSASGFLYIVLGQTMGALAFPFLLGTPQKISAEWYRPNDRGMSTTILSVMNFVGIALGYAIPAFFLNKDTKGQEGLERVSQMTQLQAYIAVPLLVMSLILFQSKPPTPPSKAAETKKLPFKDSLKSLLADKNYLIFCISSGLNWGSFLAAGVVIQPILEPFGYGPDDISIYGAAITLCGLVGSIVFGGYVGKTKKYKRTIIILTSVANCILLLSYPLAQTGSFIILGLGLAGYGMLLLPFLPIALEYVCELTFPVAEVTSAGLMIVCSQLFYAGLGVLIDFIVETESKQNSLIAMTIMFGVGSLGTIGQIITKEVLKRDLAEKKGQLLSNDNGALVES
jgi:Sugar phosphate permease